MCYIYIDIVILYLLYTDRATECPQKAYGTAVYGKIFEWEIPCVGYVIV